MDYPKAEIAQRIIAKLFDLSLGLLLSQFGLPGILLGTLYVLIADFLFDGQSLGKKAMKLKVLKVTDFGEIRSASLWDVMIRNAMFSSLTFLICVPIIKYLAYLVFPLALALELYFVVFDPKGLRLGDIYAETLVVPETFKAAA